MNELNELDQLCMDLNVDLTHLLAKVNDGIRGVSISHFTDDELKVIQSALDLAGGF